jgi:hypothetical protein
MEKIVEVKTMNKPLLFQLHSFKIKVCQQINQMFLGPKHVNIELTEFTSAVRTAKIQVGAGAANNASEPKDMELMIDTRNYFTVLFDNTCENCNNTQKYIMHENATKWDDLKLSKVYSRILNSNT